MSDVAILVPVLGREYLLEPLLESIHNTCDASVYFATTRADTKPREELKRLGYSFVDITRKPMGDYARKINNLAKRCDEPYLFLGATDLIFHEYWMEKALAKTSDKIHVVGTNDMGNKKVLRGQHSTHTLVSRKYMQDYGLIDKKGLILNEEYPHEFVDDELVQTAQYRGMFAMARNSLVEHIHPMWGKAEWDAGYLAGDSRYLAGRRIFRQRKKLWTE